jgi:hypothetical protein
MSREHSLEVRVGTLSGVCVEEVLTVVEEFEVDEDAVVRFITARQVEEGGCSINCLTAALRSSSDLIQASSMTFKACLYFFILDNEMKFSNSGGSHCVRVDMTLDMISKVSIREFTDMVL